ncbi:MAG: RidA family protein [Planctomycetes bacterium]|nr:RidA family protein [Planctomycetota bacterium]
MKRTNISSGAKWEAVVGYSRAVRVGERIFVTGTTAWLPEGGHVGDGDAYLQARQALRNIEWALGQAGSGLRDVVRTRLFVTDIRRDWEAIGRAHAECLGAVRPATTMVEVARLIEDWMLVEIEADALVGSGEPG